MQTLKVILESICPPAWAASLDLWDAYLHVPGVPPFPIRQRHVPFVVMRVCRSPLRSFHLLQGVHPGGGSDREGTAATGDLGVHVLGRLDCRGPLPRGNGCGSGTDMADGGRSRLHRQCREVAPGPLADSVFLGGPARPLCESRPANSGAGDKSHPMHVAFSAGGGGSGPGLVEVVGSHGQHGRLINFCRLRMCPIQLHLLSVFRPSWHSIACPVPTAPFLVPHLRWWMSSDNLMKGRSFRHLQPSVTITTDASLVRMGGPVCPHCRRLGYGRPISGLSMSMCWRCWRCRWPSGVSSVRFPTVRIRCDNTTVVAYIHCQFFLVAPFWPRQAWFPRLLRLLVHRPVVLPRRPDILFQPRSNYLHPALGNLHLACWVLFPDPSAQRAFRSGLRSWRQAAVDLPPGRSTTADYVFSLDGVNSTLIVLPILL